MRLLRGKTERYFMKTNKNTGCKRSVEEKLQSICTIFGVPGTYEGYETIVMGNINNTYKVTYLHPDGFKKNYIVQKVNMYVFRKPRQIMSNIDLITTHIKNKNALNGITDTRSFMHFYHTHNGGHRKNFYVDDDHGFWRVSKYIEDSVTYNVCDDPSVLEEAGEAFGRFQAALADFDAQKLFETIPDFHNTKKRMRDFFRHVNEDSCDRVESVSEEIDYIASVRDEACRLSEMLEAGKLPLRVTHNDTKINNVLFDRESEKALVVIDLDTVMPGLVAHDFGDAVRFAANTAAEDEADLSKVSFDLAKFEAFTKGFIPPIREALSVEEMKTLALGALTMTVELAERFLDDYITGDNYFKIKYPGHNIVRTRCQIALAKDIQNKFGEMEAIVERIYNS